MNFQQQPHTLLMIRPKRFAFNAQTAESNVFQNEGVDNAEEVLHEFETMVDLLHAHEIAVVVFDDTTDPVKPDAIFPNNWVSLHHDGTAILFSMMAENRRAERRKDVLEKLNETFVITNTIDLSAEEKNGRFLEGTGSIVFDHINRLAYACRSPRTSETLLSEFCATIKYKPVLFDAVDEKGIRIYHTNVVMGIGEKFAVVCLDAIRGDEDQERVLNMLAETGHKVISISYEQMKNFAGNVIEVKSRAGEDFLLISETALKSLLPGQINAITQFAEVLPISIPTIEKIGGGSVRCMVAGVHLPFRKVAS